MMRRWYVVNTHVRGEEMAAVNLGNQGFEPYLPRYLKKRSHARSVVWLPAPMFPRYLFVQLDPENEQWRAIRSTVGVSHFLCQGDTPTPVPDGVVESIRARENDQGLVTLGLDQSFRRGDPVRVTHGPMADMVGIFECVDDQARVFILLDLMGRQVKVRLSRDVVAAR